MALMRLVQLHVVNVGGREQISSPVTVSVQFSLMPDTVDTVLLATDDG